MATPSLRLHRFRRDGRQAGALEYLIAFLLIAVGVTLGGSCSPTPQEASSSPVAATDPSPTVLSATSTPQPSPTAVPTAVQQKPTPPPAGTPVPAAVAAKVQGILTKTAGVRSLPPKGEVPVSLLPRNQLRSYLIAMFEKERTRAELDKDWATLVLLDLLREEDDLYRLWVNLLSEQIVGMYELDSREMKLVGVGETLSPVDEMVLAHEFVHALQDQHFEVGARLKKAKGAGENALALQALMEGDATLASGLYAGLNLGADQLAAIAKQSGGTSQEKLRSAPPVLQASLLFPYQQGAVFVSSLLQSGGWPAVDRAYANPPVTSEQVLHPAKYLAGEGPIEVKVPDVVAALGSQWLLWKEDVLGELGVLAYLANGVPPEKALKAATGWGGDRTLLFRSLSGHNYALVVATAWDTPEDAAEFYSAVRDLRTSRRGSKLTFLDDKRMTWAVPYRNGYAALDGSQVVLVITPDEPTTRKIVRSLESASPGGSP